MVHLLTVSDFCWNTSVYNDMDRALEMASLYHDWERPYAMFSPVKSINEFDLLTKEFVSQLNLITD